MTTSTNKLMVDDVAFKNAKKAACNLGYSHMSDEILRQIIEAAIASSKHSAKEESVRFYDFDDLENERKAYKQGWNDALEQQSSKT